MKLLLDSSIFNKPTQGKVSFLGRLPEFKVKMCNDLFLPTRFVASGLEQHNMAYVLETSSEDWFQCVVLRVILTV